jgi:hypothetical protein
MYVTASHLDLNTFLTNDPTSSSVVSGKCIILCGNIVHGTAFGGFSHHHLQGSLAARQ